MKHIFSIKVKTTKGENSLKITNRNIFSTVVTGFAAVVDRLKVPEMKVKVVQTFTAAALNLYRKIIEEGGFYANVNVKINNEISTKMRPENPAFFSSSFAVLHKIALSIYELFGSISESVVKTTLACTVRFLLLLANLMSSNVKVSQTLTDLKLAYFYRLLMWDYDENSEPRLLSIVDEITLYDMDEHYS